MKLTEREKEVVARVVLAQKRTAIAGDLGISVHTVDAYLRRIRLKTNLHSMLEVAVFFARQTSLPHSRE